MIGSTLKGKKKLLGPEAARQRSAQSSREPLGTGTGSRVRHRAAGGDRRSGNERWCCAWSRRARSRRSAVHN